MSQDKKVVLITGGSSGIGEATALEFAKLGYRVAITGLERADLDKVLEELVAASPSKSVAHFLALQADFGDPAQVDPIVRATVGQFGQLDVLVNNAGCIGKGRSLGDEDFFEDFKVILQVNLIAATRLAQLATPHLIKTKGVIINMSSVVERVGIPTIAYGVSKAGMASLSKCLATRFSGTGVRVVAVAPGPIENTSISRRPELEDGGSNILEHFAQLIPLKRNGTPIEVAQTIVFLSSDKASFINGCTIDVDGGCFSNFGGVFSHLVKPLVVSE